jgi:hypothetical protein
VKQQQQQQQQCPMAGWSSKRFARRHNRLRHKPQPNSGLAKLYSSSSQSNTVLRIAAVEDRATEAGGQPKRKTAIEEKSRAIGSVFSRSFQGGLLAVGPPAAADEAEAADRLWRTKPTKTTKTAAADGRGHSNHERPPPQTQPPTVTMMD